jgi:hypothetical protein
MPLTRKDRKLRRNFDRYGKDKDRVFYATLNKRINEGRPIDVPESRRLEKKRRHHHKRRMRSRRRRV